MGALSECIHVYVPCVSGAQEDLKKASIPWHWSYRWL